MIPLHRVCSPSQMVLTNRTTSTGTRTAELARRGNAPSAAQTSGIHAVESASGKRSRSKYSMVGGGSATIQRAPRRVKIAKYVTRSRLAHTRTAGESSAAIRACVEATRTRQRKRFAGGKKSMRLNIGHVTMMHVAEAARSQLLPVGAPMRSGRLGAILRV